MLSRRSFLARAVAGLAAAACERVAPALPTASPSTVPSSPLPLDEPVPVSFTPPRWLLIEPSTSGGAPGHVRIGGLRFARDPRGGSPHLRLLDRKALLAEGPDGWSATLDLSGLPSGSTMLAVVELLSGGREAVVANATVTLSRPVYVVWTIDHEGYDEPDALAANVAAVAQEGGMALTILFHPRVLVPGAVSIERRDAILRWTRGRLDRGDEVGMHLHLQFDYVRDAGVAPRTAPRWGIGVGGDGYDVPLTTYDEDEQRRLIRHGIALMAAAGLPRPTSFRGGGLFADARTLRVLAAEGFTADTSGREAGATGALRGPWTLPLSAQPYRPNRDDANRSDPPTLDLLEVPNTAGNTFGHTVATIGELVDRTRAIWPGGASTTPRVLDYVSHPSTFTGAERAAVERLFAPLFAARADRDAGPVRFVTLRDLVRLLA